MCGRFTLRTPQGQLVEQFMLFEMGKVELQPRYNIAPSQSVAAVRLSADTGRRRLDMLRWGLIPSWAKDPAIGNRLINARAETVADKPSFRHSLRHRRCLVLADGYYEWQNRGSKVKKQPYYIHMSDGQPFAMAGLWECWWDADEKRVETCTIITTEANERTRSIHDRMPAILLPEQLDCWLDTRITDPAKLQPLPRPYPSRAMAAHPVDTLVNNPRNDTPQCIVATEAWPQ